MRFLVVCLLALCIGCRIEVKTKQKTEVVCAIDTIKLDYSKMPSYCSPVNYRIVKGGDGYYVKLPGGTSLSYEVYATAEEAQERINELALDSRRSWEKSGGVAF